MAEQKDDWQDVAKGLQAKAAPRERITNAAMLETVGEVAMLRCALSQVTAERDEARAALSAAEQASRAAGVWVPVTERLPADDTEVLWVMPSGGSEWADRIDIGRCRGDVVENYNWHRDIPIAEFTHWMPLPAPPSPVAGGPGGGVDPAKCGEAR